MTAIIGHSGVPGEVPYPFTTILLPPEFITSQKFLFSYEVYFKVSYIISRLKYYFTISKTDEIGIIKIPCLGKH